MTLLERHGLRIIPQAFPPLSCILLQTFQYHILRRTFPIPPAPALFDQRVIDVGAIAERFMSWCAKRAIELRHIQLGKPEQNAFIDRYNRTYRTEVLNPFVVEFLEQVREISAEWLRSYNEERPHESAAGLPPAMYRATLEAKSSPLEVPP